MVQGNVLGRTNHGAEPSNMIITEYDGDGITNKDIILDPRTRYVVFHTEPLNAYPVEIDLVNNKWAYYSSTGTNLGTAIASATMSKITNGIRQSGFPLVSESGKHYVMAQYL